MIKKKRNTGFLGTFIFMLLIAVVTTLSIVIYSFVFNLTKGNYTVITLVMVLTIIFLSVVCTVIDVIRRKIMVEQPTQKILSATERIARGDFSARIDITHPLSKYDEYDIIMFNINEMAEELSKNEMLKNDFISNVSHEIKTPLSIIQNYATALKNDKLDAQTRKKYTDVLLTATQRLTSLVSNILKLNKLENSTDVIEKGRVRLDESVAQAVLSFESVIERKNIELLCDFDEITVNSCSSYLDVVWNNLISNAVKFTDDGGKIIVSVKKRDDTAVVKVTDTGCGISADTGARIFEKFYQGDTSHSGEGNGLGLALVKRVIDLLGGTISVSSKLGEGSTFTVTVKDAE